MPDSDKINLGDAAAETKELAANVQKLVFVGFWNLI